VADAVAPARADLGSPPQYLPGDVADGHAALDAWRTRPIAAVAYIVFAVFPTMGGNYQAAVISARFTGIDLGATPTVIANMAAVTKLHGACAQAFIILPLVSAFFTDIANGFAIGFMAR
jgi:ESS family glutamate:Na+ symporter